jgi:predicted DCC family thiol-disulfide oxidoreductase YuxK
MNPNKVQVYFDGLCQLCSREVSHYSKQLGSENIQFVDITHPDFDASKLGLDPIRVNQKMHVRKINGELAVGVDGFITIWETLPRYHYLARLIKMKVPHALLTLGYSIFARYRHYLPRKKSNCSTSPYCLR